MGGPSLALSRSLSLMAGGSRTSMKWRSFWPRCVIGYHVAGIAGAVVATLAMCGPTSLLAFAVGRASERFTGAVWHGALSRGLIPVTIGLTAASATVIASIADFSWVAAAITLATACIALCMRLHPLWAFAAAALLGLAGLI